MITAIFWALLTLGFFAGGLVLIGVFVYCMICMLDHF